jgi:glycosyltransferase involved in cell wall biosynthesis
MDRRVTREHRDICVGFATELAIGHKAAWSGTQFHMMEALREAGVSIRTVGPFFHSATILAQRTGKVLNLILGYDPQINRTHVAARIKGGALSRRMRADPVDVLFAPAGSTLIAYETSGTPIVHVSDATVLLLADYYESHSGLPRSTLNRAVAIERKALDRADLLLYPTHWAARSAIEDYGMDPEKIFVQPFGANILDPPARDSVTVRQPSDRIHLLFCGVDWKRKGGHIALETLRALRETGHDAVLCIMGCVPDPADLTEDLRDHVTVLPFLNKAVPAELARFRDAFRRADFLVLPTRAECYGMVFCEAAAFGVMSITTATGGTPEVVREGVVGHTLPPEATGADYAETIDRVLRQPEGLADLRRRVRADYDARLNWQTWAQAVMPRVRQLVRG